jgi:hypothetical protein
MNRLIPENGRNSNALWTITIETVRKEGVHQGILPPGVLKVMPTHCHSFEFLTEALLGTGSFSGFSALIGENGGSLVKSALSYHQVCSLSHS